MNIPVLRSALLVLFIVQQYRNTTSRTNLASGKKAKISRANRTSPKTFSLLSRRDARRTTANIAALRLNVPCYRRGIREEGGGGLGGGGDGGGGLGDEGGGLGDEGVGDGKYILELE